VPGVAAHDSLFVLLRPGVALPSRAQARNYRAQARIYPTQQNKGLRLATPGTSSV